MEDPGQNQDSSSLWYRPSIPSARLEIQLEGDLLVQHSISKYPDHGYSRRERQGTLKEQQASSVNRKSQKASIR